MNTKKLAGIALMAMALCVGSCFADAVPAYNSAQEWLAVTNQQAAEKAKEESAMHVYSENYDYMAAPAFDSANDAVECYEEETELKAKEESTMHCYSENYDYMAISAF